MRAVAEHGSEEPTLVDRERPGAPSMAPGDAEPSRDTSRAASLGATATASTSIASVRRGEELQRTLALMRLVAGVSLAGIVSIWLPTRPYEGRWLTSFVFGVTLLVTLWLLVRFRDARRYDSRLVTLQGLCCVAGVLVAVYFVGVFSPTIMALCVGIYFFGLGDSVRAGWTIYLAGAGGYAVLGALGVAGVVRLDRSVLALSNLDPIALGAIGAVAQIMLALTFWMARRSRDATLSAFDRLERAARQIRQRDALLDEARHEFERVQGPKLGRWTGQQVGDYHVEDLIGRGAVGEVYAARNVVTGEARAVKLLHPAALEDRGQVERFLREAEIAGRLDSEHVVRIHQTGEAPDGSPFIAMELLEGRDLAQHLRSSKRLGSAAVLELVTQVASALSAADDADIVHRDLKPQNLVLVEQRGRRIWKVLDFGVSKVAGGSGTLTQGIAVGTPSYMSPEQARSQHVDHRTDVFALGVIAYRALTGRPAFTGADMVATLYNVLHVQPARPGDLARLPEDVERVLALALAKDRERRFASAATFADALRQALRGRLDRRARQEADALIAEHPWGTDDERSGNDTSG
jgi:serine/threonine-protein kinase